jgi:hypothetical protein
VNSQALSEFQARAITIAQTKLATVSQYGDKRVNVGTKERLGSLGSGTVSTFSDRITIVRR